MKKKENMKPNPFAWFIYITGGRLFMAFKNKLYINNKVYKKRNKKESCIVLYNHASSRDHYITSLSVGYDRVAYVTTSHFFYDKKLRRILRLVKAIPKDQFKSDIATIKKIKRAIQQKLPVAISPVGQITVHGEPLSVDFSIVKLIKMCNVDVYSIQIHGNYFAYPKWRKHNRKNPIHVDFVKVFNKEDLKTLSDDEIYKKTCESIEVVDRNEIKKYNYKLTSKGLIEGIEDILYQCPKCHEKYHMVSNKDILTCEKCGNSVKMIENGMLVGASSDYVMFQNEALWYYWEQNNILNDMKKDFILEGRFKMFLNSDKEHPYVLNEVGDGKLVLTNDSLYYEGSKDGISFRKDFMVDRLTHLPFEVRNFLVIPDDEGYYKFETSDGENSCKIIEFVQAIEARNELKKSRL